LIFGCLKKIVKHYKKIERPEVNHRKKEERRKKDIEDTNTQTGKQHK